MAFVLLALLSAACGPAAEYNEPGGKSGYSLGREMHYLDIRHPAVAFPVPPAAAARRPKFVIATIGPVTNPVRAPLTFAVAFRSPDGGTIELGSFSLYPADNPGRFIVATQGKVAANGEILLTLQDPNTKGANAVRVGVAELALGDE